MTRRPINSAAEPHGRTAAGSLDQNDFVATNGPEIGARAAASAPDSTSQVSNSLAVLAELSVADLRLEWRRRGGALRRSWGSGADGRLLDAEGCDEPVRVFCGEPRPKLTPRPGICPGYLSPTGC